MRTSRAVEIILTILQGGTETAIGLLEIMTQSRREASRALHQPMKHGFRFDADWAERYRDHQRFHNLLQYLKHQGLIERKAGARGSPWQITKRGLSKLAFIKRRMFYGAQSAVYESKSDTTFKIITYDIPATRDGQYQRQWLRNALKNLGFELLQKSVWAGKRTIPEIFLKDIRERNLLAAVQIFAVTKTGTLQALT